MVALLPVAAAEVAFVACMEESPKAKRNTELTTDDKLIDVTWAIATNERLKTCDIAEKYGISRTTAWRWMLKISRRHNVVLDRDGYWVRADTIAKK